MASNGPHFWTNPLVNDPVYLDGRTFDALDGPSGISWSQTSGLIVVRTLAGTHVLLRPYYGTGAPTGRDALTFSMSFLIADEDDYRAIQLACAKAASVYMCPFVRCLETFDATSGSSYSLSRPLATGIVTGVTAVTHPSVILLAGAVSPGSGSVSGQTLSATATGQVGVEYTPVFRVVPRIAQEFSEPNGLVVALDCEEVIQV